MSDQQEIETSRYARKSVTVRGLMANGSEASPNAKVIMAEHGVMWDLTGKTNLEPMEITDTTIHIEGEELPMRVMTTSGQRFVLSLAEKHGLEISKVSQTREVLPDTPYMSATLRFSMGNGEWSDLTQTDRLGHATLKADLSRSSRTLTLTIEGNSKDEVANDMIDEWISGTVRQVRKALAAAGYAEDEIHIDCEVIMGAEREAKCDPNLMRSLLTAEDEEEEE